jgi:Beta-propeller repeat
MKKTIFFITSCALILSSCEKTETPPEEPTTPSTTYTVADFTLNWKKSWGTTYADDFGGGVVDASGNMYYTGATQPDGSYADMFITKINLATQALVWSKSFDGGNQDFQASSSENGHSQGGAGSRNIAIDSNGDIYICGNTKQGFYEVVVMKINSAGTILWQKYWEANNSGLANGEAKAYSLDVAGGKVFVTGQIASSSAFLLALNSSDGSISTANELDISAGYNDRSYTVKSTDGNTVYIAGWEGQNNSGMVSKFTNGGANLVWSKRINIGFAARFTDIDIDASENLYLGADHRGVSTYVGVVKTDSSGTVLWTKKFQGTSNDRNNISCLRLMNGNLYVGGRGSFAGYDESAWGDGLLLKFDLNGNLLKQYNFFTGEISSDKCGERIEAIIPYNGSIIVAGETWTEISQIDGKWYIPAGTTSSATLNSTNAISPYFVINNGVFSTTSLGVNTLSNVVNNMSFGTQGSCDIMINSIRE